jgi:hypothetical protein
MALELSKKAVLSEEGYLSPEWAWPKIPLSTSDGGMRDKKIRGQSVKKSARERRRGGLQRSIYVGVARE